MGQIFARYHRERTIMSLSVPGRRLLGDNNAFKQLKRETGEITSIDFQMFLLDFDLEKSIPSKDDILRWIQKMRNDDKFISSSMDKIFNIQHSDQSQIWILNEIM